MRILLHTPDTTASLLDLGDIDSATRLDTVVSLTDELLFVEDQPDPLDPSITVEDVVTVHQVEILHLHRNRHPRIPVEVRYHAQRLSEQFAPSATLGRIEKRAVRAFGISTADATDLVLRLRGAESDLDPEDHIGTLAGPHGHAVELDLVPAHRFAG